MDIFTLAGKLKRREGRPLKWRPKRFFKNTKPRLTVAETTLNGWLICEHGYIRIGKVVSLTDRTKLPEREWEMVRWALRGLEGVYDLSNYQWTKAIVRLDKWLWLLV